MIKKLFYGMMAATMLFATSCQQDDVLVPGGDTISFEVSAPQIATRAYSDGTTAEYLHYAVYDNSTNPEPLFDDNVRKDFKGRTEFDPATGKATVQLKLATGKEYNVLFWASSEEDVEDEGVDAGPYTINFNNLQMTVNAGACNDEARDAFYKFHPVNGDRVQAVTLTRPFAQLNIGTNDLAEASADGIDVTNTQIKVKAYNTLNLAKGEVAGEAKQVFTFNARPNGETFPVNGYDYLAMAYVLVNGRNLSDVVFEYGTDDNSKQTRTYNNIPMERNHRTNIYGSLLTNEFEFNVDINENYDDPANVEVVGSAAAAQAALDNAVKGTTIHLEPGVNYGTLYMRPVVNGAQTKEVDWIGNNYRFESYSLFENVTIIGAEGATIDAIEIEGGTYYKTSHSQADIYPVMLSLIELKNVVFDGVTFTGKGGYDPQGHGNAINISGNNIKVDGLTFKNCVLENSENNARLIYKTESTTHVHNYAYDGENFTFSPSLKNITITGCTFNGGYMGLELRETENITITNNTFEVSDRNILLPVNSGCTYSGKITITGNVSNNAKERFVRMSGAGDAEVVITGNTINNYLGADTDYIKVTDGTNVTINNNTLLIGVKDANDEVVEGVGYDPESATVVNGETVYTKLVVFNETGLEWIAANVGENNGFEGKTVVLNTDIDLFKGYMPDGDFITTAPIGDEDKESFKGTFDGQGHTIKNLFQNGWALNYEWGVYGSIGLFRELEGATVKNVVIEKAECYVEGGDVSFIAGSATGDCVFEYITIKNSTIATYNNGCGGIIGWSGAGNYTFRNIVLDEDVVLAGLWGSFDSSIGGIVGQAEPGATYNFENVTINCRIDAYNDCTASYDYYNYRMCGMIIGRCEETTTIDGKNYPDLSKYNLSFNNVVVNYGDWMNYHYCEPTPGHNGGRGMRVEPGYAYNGLPDDYDHTQCVDNHYNYIPFDQLIGGDQIAVKGLREVAGVTVNYPASYRRAVSTSAALTEALGKGLSVVLDADVDFGSTQLAITGENQVVDLGGHALTTSNNYGGISLKNGAAIKNGTITHAGNTAAIKAFSGSSVENVTINATCTTAGKTVTGIAVQQGANVESIKNVTINGVSQGIEVCYQATVGLIENAVVNESNNGTANGIGLVINAAKVGKAKNCTFKGETYGITMHLKGVSNVGLELENCKVEGTTASIYAWDEKGISNTSGSLTLTYDAATTLTGPFIWDFEDECKDVVTLNQPK